ncbi:MAG: hypothetical protein ACOCW2_03430 [Chitinivibrionales bacterium]
MHAPQSTGRARASFLFVNHGALIIYDTVQLITLGMIVSVHAWKILPAFLFVVLINTAYIAAATKDNREK